MKIVDAYWDTRSLGCKCGEIDFDGNESTDEIVEALNSASVFDYLVIKIPVNHLEIQEIVQNKDFHFCESSFEITIVLLSDISSLKSGVTFSSFNKTM